MAVGGAVPMTVRTVCAKIFPVVAVIVEFPMPAPVASPVPLMVATVNVPELQFTAFVRFCVLPSL